MGIPQTQTQTQNQTETQSQLYPQALQLKLYQAFIFSIPILFSIILFLLFYLFYLKRRASSLSNSPPILPTTSDPVTLYVTTACQVDIKAENPINNLPRVYFDEELRTRDSLCCVCLGEFEIKEELLQVPSCKHVFHIDCMSHWLSSNSTCPLCRCSVIPTARTDMPLVMTVAAPSEPTIITTQTAEMLTYSPQHPQLQQQEGSSQSIC